MPNQWDADIELSRSQAAGLIDSQFPGLAPARLEALGVGWDNTAWRVNGEFVFRFPRRKIAADLLATEALALPLLSPQLSLPVPYPEFDGAPAGHYPYPFAGYRMLPGTPACSVEWTHGARESAGALLGGFLARLHTLPVGEVLRAKIPGDTIGRADLAARAAKVKERLRAIAPLAPSVDVPALLELVDRLALSPRHAGPARWVHGDFYARHVLVDGGLRPCGVIDWGDVHLGDPAIDLSIAFGFLPSASRGGFLAAYGPVDAATLDRARFRAVHYGAMLVAYGADRNDPALFEAGRFALRSSSEEAVRDPSN